MTYIELYIFHATKGLAPVGWKCTKHINIQRLHYIKGGKGQMLDKSGEWVDLVPGNIYLYPNNYPQYFRTDPDDRLNHIYIDFLSNPPIIANAPLICRASDNTKLMRLIDLLDCIFVDAAELGEEDKKRMPYSMFGHIKRAEAGTDEEQKQIIYSSVHALILMLSAEQAIPFSENEMINRAVAYIHENYASRIQVSELANANYISTNKFIDRFKTVMGVTPYSYIKSLRLYHAKSLISRGSSTQKAAELTGYSDSASLMRALKEPRSE